jgi:hypothetical protein
LAWLKLRKQKRAGNEKKWGGWREEAKVLMNAHQRQLYKYQWMKGGDCCGWSKPGVKQPNKNRDAGRRETTTFPVRYAYRPFLWPFFTTREHSPFKEP